MLEWMLFRAIMVAFFILANSFFVAAEFALISVRDHGRGVPDEALPDIFLPFYRVGDARDRSSGGSGLGLSITDRAVRLHRGSVRAVNCSGGGLLIEIQLPCATKMRNEPEKVHFA